MAKQNMKDRNESNELSLLSNEEGKSVHSLSHSEHNSTHAVSPFTLGEIFPMIVGGKKREEMQNSIGKADSQMSSPQASPSFHSKVTSSSEKGGASVPVASSRPEEEVELTSSQVNLFHDHQVDEKSYSSNMTSVPSSSRGSPSAQRGVERSHSTPSTPAKCPLQSIHTSLTAITTKDPSHTYSHSTNPAPTPDHTFRCTSSPSRSPSAVACSSSARCPPNLRKTEAESLSPTESLHSCKKKRESIYYVYVNRFNLIDTAEDRRQWTSRAKQQWGGGESASGGGLSVRISSNCVVRGRMPLKPLQFNPAWSGVTWGQDIGIPVPLQEDSLLVVEVITIVSSTGGTASGERGSNTIERVLGMNFVNTQAVVEEGRQWGRFCVHVLPSVDPLDFWAVHGVVELTIVAGSCANEEQKELLGCQDELSHPLSNSIRSSLQDNPETLEKGYSDSASSSPTPLSKTDKEVMKKTKEVEKQKKVPRITEEHTGDKKTPVEQRKDHERGKTAMPVSPVTPASMIFAFTSSSAGNRGSGDVGFTTLEYNYGAVRLSTVDFFYPSFYLSGRGQYILSNVLCAMNMTESNALAMRLVPLKEACDYLQTAPSSFITVRPQQRAFFTASWILKKPRYCGSTQLELELLVHGSHTPTARILIQVHLTEPHSRPSDVPFMYWVNHSCFCNRQMMSIEELPLLKEVLPVYRLLSSSAKRAPRGRSGNGLTRSRARGGLDGASPGCGCRPLLPPPPSSTHVLGSSTASPPLLPSASSSFVSGGGSSPHSAHQRYSSLLSNTMSSFSPLPFSMLLGPNDGGGDSDIYEGGDELLDINASFVVSKAARETFMKDGANSAEVGLSSGNAGASAGEEAIDENRIPPTSSSHLDPSFSHRRIFYYGPLLCIQQRTCRCAVRLGPIRGFPFLESASGQPHAFRIAITLLDKVGWKVIVGETKPSYPTASGSLQWNETLVLQKWPGAVASQFCRLHLSEVRTTDGDETPIGAGLISLGDFNKIHERVPLCVALSVYETYSQYDQMISPSLLMKDITFCFFDVR